MLNFGKYFKYEWKSSSKVPLIILLFLAIATALACLATKLQVINDIFSGSTYGVGTSPMDLLFGLSSLGFVFVYLISLIAASVGVIVYFCINFYQSMYSRKGYLTHTLPVDSHTLLCSKILTFGLWSNIIMLATVVSLFLFIMVIAGPSDIKMLFDIVLQSFYQETGTSFAAYLIVALLCGMIQMFMTITLYLTAITIGQLSSKHKVLMSIVSFIVIMVVNSIFEMLSTALFGRYTNPLLTETVNLYPPIIFSLVLSSILAIVGYFVSNYIVRRKLNLQ
jgi:hypothetical protein